MMAIKDMIKKKVVGKDSMHLTKIYTEQDILQLRNKHASSVVCTKIEKHLYQHTVVKGLNTVAFILQVIKVNMAKTKNHKSLRSLGPEGNGGCTNMTQVTYHSQGG